MEVVTSRSNANALGEGGPGLPMQGRSARGYEDLVGQIDSAIVKFMQKFSIPGATYAAVHNRSLVAERSFGYGSLGNSSTPITPAIMMRLASVEKPFVRTAIELMCRRGTGVDINGRRVTITPNTRVFPLLEGLGLTPPSGMLPDPRIRTITLAQLRDHTSGIAQGDGGLEVMKDMALTAAPTPWEIARWVLGQPLRFDPGSKSEYSNLGYGILKTLIDRVSGSFIDYMRKEVFAPAGVNPKDVVLTRARPSDRDPRETRYFYSQSAKSMVKEDAGKNVLVPDGGGWNIDNFLCPAATASALALTLGYWHFGEAQELFDRSGARTRPGQNGGLGFNGGMPGTISTIFQDVGWDQQNGQACSKTFGFAVMFNGSIEDGPGSSTASPEERNIAQTIREILNSFDV